MFWRNQDDGVTSKTLSGSSQEKQLKQKIKAVPAKKVGSVPQMRLLNNPEEEVQPV